MGDVVLIANGMEVPADGILINAAEITADESAMTGYILHFRRNNPYHERNF